MRSQDANAELNFVRLLQRMELVENVEVSDLFYRMGFVSQGIANFSQEAVHGLVIVVTLGSISKLMLVYLRIVFNLKIHPH